MLVFLARARLAPNVPEAMVKVNDTDLDQTVIVVTHPRAKSQNQDPRQMSQVHVIRNSEINNLGLPASQVQVSGHNPVTSRHDPGDPRSTRDRIVWLPDRYPWIHVNLSRREIRPGTDWETLCEQKAEEWRAWNFLQFWRAMIHGAIRLKFKRQLWHQYGYITQMWKARGRGETGHNPRDHWLLKMFPTDREPDFPNARLIDRQDTSASSGDPLGSAEGTRSRRRYLRH